MLPFYRTGFPRSVDARLGEKGCSDDCRSSEICGFDTVQKRRGAKSLHKGIISLREKYIAEKKVVDWTTTEDLLFSSPSTAADFILGYSVSGPAQWKTEAGISLKDLESE